ncbi:hypothetical protein IQ218_12815 [Synechocystis salina LEGE 06099]|uniref:hypothetical protein n=1 Tax=Synechocystis salina TaxID=945780 RepID=UPI00187E1CBF|nr:hypothetical protein [Synechocystis salina]MBE9204157.1 hypothetical protein [Synechocystis salina LEGE 06099]
MNLSFLKKSTALSSLGLLVAAQSLLMSAPAQAETTARLDGRCKLTSDDMKVFDGHCTVKQKQRDSTTVVVVHMDNGGDYRFYGPSKQALQVETYGGIHNVQYRENDNREVFTWDEDGDRQKLAIVLDNQRPANVSHDVSPPQQQDLGAIIGAGVGALIGGLISGGGSNQSPANNNVTQGSGNPYDGKNYTATASFRCSVGNDSHNQSCPGGIMRKGNGNASVTVLYPNGNEVQYDFQGGEVTSNFSRNVSVGKNGDDWYIGIDSNLFIIIPDAAIYGG